MTDLLPAGFNCSDAVRNVAVRKLAALEAIADELPVYIIHDVRDFTVVYMSQRGLQALGATQEEIRQLGQDYFTKFFNPDDVQFYLPKFMELLKVPNQTQWFSFFQQVATGQNQSFEWYLSASRPFVYDEEDRPLLSLTFALQLDPNHHLAEKAERLMAENLLLKDNYHRFASLTKREKELLQYIASGENPTNISERAYISQKTLNTHRRNIKRKLGAKTHYDIIRFAQAFNLV
ncbi:regulatory protein, luxR family [Parapedobacter composti]|uniref:Regulatory protein, luxR family n=1 Tax=Parapedobacter composti TaxID=623281 RepID=A0A1I1GD03_9SPHI|nr:helix-turn-helix transcriptional regulator [Parapedobacter composti]SFC09451.1 regulatory protein, luxR family [Parapedobacter composti]